MTRLIDAEKLYANYQELCKGTACMSCPFLNCEDNKCELENMILQQPTAGQKWIPIKTRPMDEQERKEWSEKLGYDPDYDLDDEEAVIYVSQLPDYGQEVLTCSIYGRIRTDIFYKDENGCYFEENMDMDGIVAWMPLPEPYKEDKNERP